MIGAAGDGVGPQHNDVGKLPILGALNRHDSAVRHAPVALARLNADGFMHEFGDHGSGKDLLIPSSSRVIEAPDNMRNGCLVRVRFQSDQCSFKVQLVG
jgi:hypothetical protein